MRHWLISNGALVAQPGLRHYSHCLKGKANGALGAPLGLSQWRGQWRNDARGRDPKDHQSQALFKQGALQMTYRWMAEIYYNNGEPPKVVEPFFWLTFDLQRIQRAGTVLTVASQRERRDGGDRLRVGAPHI